MIINIAGFNVDVENIKKVEEYIKDNELKLNWTPETICTSYARISRDPSNIDIIRERARREIERARKSNENIIFEMGHSSIAEHSVFNIDIMGVSRLLSEELEKSRLVSFTEKSQRYVKIGKDFLIPEEFKKDDDFLRRYLTLQKTIFDCYNNLVIDLEKYFLEKYKGNKEIKERDVLNLAKEDARYILPLATLTQLGMTINARNLERVLKKFFSFDLIEFNNFAEILYNKVKDIAPSLIKYVKPDDYDRNTIDLNIEENYSIPEKEVELIDYEDNFIDNIIAGFIVKRSSIDYKKAKEIVKNKSIEWRNNVIKESIKNLKPYSSLKREFELSNFRFSILISATAFAQLKRHRLTTIIDGEYSPKLGVTIPQSIKEIGKENYFMENIKKVEELYYEAKEKFGYSSNYILTNSHRKNIVLQLNFRELTHITRLRSDKHAQWDIRIISDKMIEEIKNLNPLFSKILCGKDKFEKNFNEIIKT